MADARITEVCDAVVAAALALWQAGDDPPGADDEVSRTYLVPTELGTLVGRKVWVSPVSFEDGVADRQKNLGDYGVALVIAERYVGAEARPPRDWLDVRVKFVQDLYDLLGSYGNRRASDKLMVGSPPNPHYTAAASVGEVYAIEYLDKHHAFWAEMELTIRGVH